MCPRSQHPVEELGGKIEAGFEDPRPPLQRHLEALKSDAKNYIINENDLELRGEQPEPMYILRMLRNFNMTPYAGGLFDQPYLLLRELQTVIEAEVEAANELAETARKLTENQGTP